LKKGIQQKIDVLPNLLIMNQKISSLLINIQFSLFLLFVIAINSCLGSVIEQEQPLEYYQINYPSSAPIYGFLDWKFITWLGLDHWYSTVFFFSLLILLGICLIACTFTRQVPILKNSKEIFFKKQKLSFSKFPIFVSFPNRFYSQEIFLTQIQKHHFSIFQKQNVFYGYKGLIGRISPILVHVSLLLILGSSFFDSFINLKAKEVIAKGELFRIQNPIQIGSLTSLPMQTARVNDFWVEYEKKRIHQFYSTLSLLDSFGNEVEKQTLSVNNPLRYHGLDFYQSDWNLLGLRIQINENEKSNEEIYEIPLFRFPQKSKMWITWVPNSKQNQILLFDQFENILSIYDQTGNFQKTQSIGESIDSNLRILEVLPSTGLLMKYSPSIYFLYFGFGLLMITSCLSYLPYTQIWFFQKSNQAWVSSNTNRGKIRLELEFENSIRILENFLVPFRK
jgi:cytochrome c biogenesis protein